MFEVKKIKCILLGINTLLKIGKWYWILIFTAVAILEFIQDIEYDKPWGWLYTSHIPLLLFIGLLIFHRNWLSWLFMVFVCMYGLFDLFAYAPQASSPTKMDFGFRLSYFFNNSVFDTPARYLFSPLFFFFITLILYFTKAVRRKYFKSDGLKDYSL